MKFEIYNAKPENLLRTLLTDEQDWRWRLRANNGEIIASGEGYTTRQNCLHAIELVINTNHQTPVIEATN